MCKRLLAAHKLEDLMKIVRGEDNTGPLFAPDKVAILSAIPGIGPEKARQFVAWFENEANIKVYDKLMSEVNIKQAQSASVGELCKGLTFVITGDVNHYKNRNDLKAYIESEGGKVTGSVSKSTSYLINNDINSTSTKNKKANQLGIPIISENDFIDRFTQKA